MLPQLAGNQARRQGRYASHKEINSQCAAANVLANCIHYQCLQYRLCQRVVEPYTAIATQIAMVDGARPKTKYTAAKIT